MPLITNLQNPLTSKSKEPDHPERTGGQSPPPETQTPKQMDAASSGTTSPSSNLPVPLELPLPCQTTATDQKEINANTLKNLESNPVAPMDATADAKTRKPGAPLDGL
ncbi:hypothetical protein ABW19_dt0200929 [Dactylella cylindrospora]|nr:hypothetical protein ABW19_dt0200929 [Dactylella cylindrospora]